MAMLNLEPLKHGNNVDTSHKLCDAQDQCFEAEIVFQLFPTVWSRKSLCYQRNTL